MRNGGHGGAGAATRGGIDDGPPSHPAARAASVETAVDAHARGPPRLGGAAAGDRGAVRGRAAARRPTRSRGLEGWLPSSDLASVYRNLDTLEELGLVRHFHVGHGAGLYALASASELEFVTCEQCGALEAVPGGRLDGARVLIQREPGYRARFSHFPIVGTSALRRPRERSRHACTFLTGSSPRGRARLRDPRGRGGRLRPAAGRGGPRRAPRPAARRDRRVRLRRPDAQLPGRRRHERPLPRSRARGGAARAVARRRSCWPWCCSSRRSCSRTAASRRSAPTSSTWA